MSELVGKIISISDLNVTVLASGAQVKNRDILYSDWNGRVDRYEVNEVRGNVVSCIPLGSVIGLKKGLDLYKESDSLMVRITMRSWEKYLIPTESCWITALSKKWRKNPFIPEIFPWRRSMYPEISSGPASKCWISSHPCRKVTRWDCWEEQV